MTRQEIERSRLTDDNRIRPVAPTDAERKRRPVELRLTFVQASALAARLDRLLASDPPSRDRAALAYVRDHLKAAHKAAAWS